MTQENVYIRVNEFKIIVAETVAESPNSITSKIKIVIDENNELIKAECYYGSLEHTLSTKEVAMLVYLFQKYNVKINAEVFEK